MINKKTYVMPDVQTQTVDALTLICHSVTLSQGEGTGTLEPETKVCSSADDEEELFKMNDPADAPGEVSTWQNGLW
jgi:hypothetical protein